MGFWVAQQYRGVKRRDPRVYSKINKLVRLTINRPVITFIDSGTRCWKYLITLKNGYLQE